MSRVLLAPLSFLLVVASLAPSSALAVEGSNSPSGDVRLGPCLSAHYEYHYDRNALRDSRRAGDSLIALTRAGNLLRFDAGTLKLTGEWFGPVPATCLGRGEGDSVLAGFADGRVCRVDPAMLAMAEVAHLPDRVQWIGYREAGPGRRGGIVAVVEMTMLMEGVSDGGRRYQPIIASGMGTWRGWQEIFSVIYDLPSGNRIAIPPIRGLRAGGQYGRTQPYFDDSRRASAFLLDSKGRLWLGAALGQWGGWCATVDPGRGKLHWIDYLDEGKPKRIWDWVYGFAELRDGQVWAFGGHEYQVSDEAFIRRIDRGRAEDLFSGELGKSFIAGEPDPPDTEPDRPHTPITNVVEAPDGDLWLSSGHKVYRTDRKFERWAKARELSEASPMDRYRESDSPLFIPGLHIRDDRGLSATCATAWDGLITLDDGKETSHALPGQLGAPDITRIIDSAEGTFFSVEREDGDPRATPWRLRDGRWEIAQFRLPIGLPAVDERGLVGGPVSSWFETRPFVGPRGTLYVVANARNNVYGDPDNPSRFVTARWRNGRAEVLGNEPTGIDPDAPFVTPDGVLWGAVIIAADPWVEKTEGRVLLLRFIDGTWTTVAERPAESGSPEAKPFVHGDHSWPGVRFDITCGLRVVNGSGPPWILLDRQVKGLRRLAHGPNFRDPRLSWIPLSEGGRVLRVYDALPRPEGDILLATDAGLRRFDAATNTLGPGPLPAPGHPVTSLARDGLGRVWLGGEGLWLVDPDGKTLHDVGALPMVGRTPVVTVAADPGHRDGVIVSLGARGVVFVRVAPGS